ncbi:unnamed protein product, partial [Mesorhabditis belari]|uniref:Uncharacterized protein n=1 Tax=Mesorhabditis belari TaxID=2138241 RepID=A0AAF3E9X7_9BILA
MSLAAAPTGPPDAKRFKMSLPTQVVVVEESNETEESAVVGEESPGAPSSARSSNPALDEDEEESGDEQNIDEDHLPVIDSTHLQSHGASWPEEETSINTGNLMEFISKNLLASNFKMEDGNMRCASASRCGSLSGVSPAPLDGLSSPRRSSPPPSVGSGLPGSKVVAQSPVAQLFAQNDWSWHRNPAAAIRSGGTNKQTPVWKYFVYNKAENLSRCIVGDCTYQLKGPHTSTLACHLKKHPLEYSEFQKLKVDYTSTRPQPSIRPQMDYPRDRTNGQLPPSPSSSASSATSSGGSAGNGALKMEERKPKEKNTQANKNISNIVDALNRQAAAAAQAQAQVANIGPQSLMGGMGGMGGLGLLHPALPPPGFPFLLNPAAIPTSTNNLNFAQQFLQQQQNVLNNMVVSNNGNLLTNKKWRKEERKQKELETRLALMLSASHIESKIVNNTFFRDFMELSQPKFNIPDDPLIIEKMISSEWSKVSTTLKTHLGLARRITILVDIIKTPSRNGEDECMRVCVAAAYLAVPTNKLDWALLAVRSIFMGDKYSVSIRDTIKQVIDEYEVPMERVGRILISIPDGIEFPLQGKETQPLLPKLMHHLAAIIEASPRIEALRCSFYGMLYSFISRPHLFQTLQKMTEEPLSLTLSDPFPVLADIVIRLKKEMITIMRQEEDCTDQLTEQQWQELETLVSLYNQLSARLDGAPNGQIATIDGVVPSVMQLALTLDKDMGILGDLAVELSKALKDGASVVLDPQHPNFDGSFLQATALNPQLALLLDDIQIAYAKEAIEKAVQEKMRQHEEANGRRQKAPLGVDALLASVLERKQSVDAEIGDQIMNGMNSSASLYPDLLQVAQQKRTQDMKPPIKNRFAEALVNAYFDEILSPVQNESGSLGGRPFSGRHLPPLAFWASNAPHAAPLADVATTQLSTLAFTLTPERIFSGNGMDIPVAGVSFDAAGLPLENERFERDVLLRYNKHFISRTPSL